MTIQMELVKTYTEAKETILSACSFLKQSTESLNLIKTLGRTLAEDVYSDICMPLADNSAMDGYCVLASDIAKATKASPVTLSALKGIDAGHCGVDITPGHCSYIATGATLPPGADAIVKIEDIEKIAENKIRFYGPVKPGSFIRKKAGELSEGDLVAASGTLITPYVAGLLASSGRNIVTVKRKPVIAVLTAGDELVMPWEQPQPWQARNANTVMLCLQIEDAGAQPINAGIASDQVDHCRKLFINALDHADMIITSGGISMGRRDPFKTLFTELGIKPLVYGVSIKPGKPVFFGIYKDKPVLALPGNQVSSAVCFELFARPFIQKALGLNNDRIELELELSEDSINGSGRDFFERAKLRFENGVPKASPLSKQGSHMLSGLVDADMLYIHPHHTKVLKAGSQVKCILLKG